MVDLALEGGISPVVDGVAFSFIAQICSLGMLLDPALLMEPQASSGGNTSLLPC